MTTRSLLETVRLTLVGACLFAVLPEIVVAQPVPNCGEYCGPCGTGAKEGTDESANGEYDMRCITTSGGCSSAHCNVGGLVSDNASVASLVTKMSTLPLSSLVAAAKAWRGRLYLHPSRNLVAFRGEGCAANSIVAVAFLSRERLAILAKGGLPHLEDFLEAEPNGSHGIAQRTPALPQREVLLRQEEPARYRPVERSMTPGAKHAFLR
jgi:hypothetical protein